MDGKAVKVKQHVTITDGTKQHIHTASSNSPTPELINDIVAEITAPEPQQILKPINKLVVMDSTAEKYTADLTASDFTIYWDGWTELNMQITDDIRPFNTLELRHNSTPYFRAVLSTPITSAGPYNIRWGFDVWISFPFGYGILRDASKRADTSFNVAAAHILAQKRETRNLRIETITAEQEYPPLVLLEAPAEGRPEEKKIVLPPTRFRRSGMLELIKVKGTASTYTIPLSLATAFKVTTADVLYLEIIIVIA